MSSLDSAPELVIIRIFDAPRELVWEAWTDPTRLLEWAGPRDYPATQVSGDLRKGGAWRTCLKGREKGEEMWHGGVYREVRPPERLAFTFAWDGDDGKPENEMLITITFRDLGPRTEMTFRQSGFRSDEQRDGHRGGWSSVFDRFAEMLAKK